MADPQEQLATEAEPEPRTPEEYARDIEEAYRALKRSRIRKGSSAPNTRASSIGHPCDRFLYYERTVNEQRVPHDEDLQAIFDLGNLDEGYLLRELEEAGISIVQRGRDFLDRDLQLAGHVDARVRKPGWPRSLVAEIKSLNPFTWDEIADGGLDAIRRSSTLWLRKYHDQLQTYLYLSAEELGLFLLLNKSTGRLRVVPAPLDYDYAEGLLKKAERVRDAVRSGTEPERITGLAAAEACPACAFRFICCPDSHFGPGVQFFDSAEAEELIRRRLELEPAHKEYEKADKALKQILPATAGELLVGEYAVIAKQQSRKETVQKASTFLVRSYKRVPKGEVN